VRWIGRRRGVRADDGPADAQAGIEADRMEWQNVTDGIYRCALLDVDGNVIASFDMDRGDLHDTRRAISLVLQKPRIGR